MGDRKRLLRERRRLVKERTSLTNAIKGLLKLHGVFHLEPRTKGFDAKFAEVSTGCDMYSRYSAASTDDIRARTSVASQIAGTSISPAMICARASISPAHISSEMCAVRSTCTESSASWMA